MQWQVSRVTWYLWSVQLRAIRIKGDRMENWSVHSHMPALPCNLQPLPQDIHIKIWKHVAELALGLLLFDSWCKITSFLCCRSPINILSLLLESSWTMRRYSFK